jgi:hypothetical protein
MSLFSQSTRSKSVGLLCVMICSRYLSWLRHYVTKRKVAGSIPDDVIGFFNSPNHSSRSMVQVSVQPLTELSTTNLPGGKGLSAYKADNLTAICDPVVQKMWEPRLLATIWASTACYGDTFTFLQSGDIPEDITLHNHCCEKLICY